MPEVCLQNNLPFVVVSRSRRENGRSRSRSARSSSARATSSGGRRAGGPMPEVCLQNNLPFVVVSYFTREYRAPVLRLIDSCRKTGLDFYIIDVESRGSWLENVRRRPAFLLSIFPTTARDLVWIDADGMVRSFPELFRGARATGYALAAHRN